MSDVDANDFYRRIARIQRDHARGYGMEAEGTLGRSYYGRRRRQRVQKRSLFAPALMLVLSFTALKGVLHAKIGDDVYAARVEALMAGQEFERLGGYIMQAGPITLAISRELRILGV